jgi:hypothetical protein
MWRLLVAAVLLFSALYGVATVRTAQLPAPTPDICTGGVFRGVAKPTYSPELGDRRNCRAMPTRSRNMLGHGPVTSSEIPQVVRLMERSPHSPLRRVTSSQPNNVAQGLFVDLKTFARAAHSRARARHASYHFAGTTTNDFSYQALGGYLQVRNPTVPSGGHVVGTYLWTPDDSYYFQVGWTDEGYGTNYPRVFAETNIPGGCCRYYFDQYPLSVGAQYWFYTVSKPAGPYGLIWWNDRWNELHPISSSLQREGKIQQFLEIYSADGTHPTVTKLNNFGSELNYFDTIYTWDTSFSTQIIQSSPYVTIIDANYYEWRAGS